MLLKQLGAGMLIQLNGRLHNDKLLHDRKEQQFLTVAHIDKNQWHNWGNGLDPAYVYFDFIDLTDAGMGIMEAKGLLSSLFGKNIIEVIGGV